MQRRRPVQAVFFDFDGVIVDSVALKEQAFRDLMFAHAAEHLGPIMDYYQANGGVSRLVKFQHIWAEILHRPLPNEELSELGEEFTRRVYDLVVACSLINGAQEFLMQYSTRWPCFVLSGTPEPELRSVIKDRMMMHYFQGVFGSPPTKTQIGRRLFQEYGFEPGSVWFVGDATTDRDAARELGTRFVGIDGPHLTPFLAGGELTIPDLTFLPSLLLAK